MSHQTTINQNEIAKFARLADHWWDKDGELKTLHDINPLRLDWVKQFIALSNKQVLDVGCGGGILSESLAIEGALVCGLDAQTEVINCAKRHAKENALEITYHCSSIEEFESSPFDAITCMEMLEHVDEPQLVINHCARLLKPGGYLFLSTLNRSVASYASAIIAAEYLLGLLPRQTHEYNKFITPAELASMVRNAGLEVTGLTGMAYNPFSRQTSFCDSVSVNYLMSCFKA